MPLTSIPGMSQGMEAITTTITEEEVTVAAAEVVPTPQAPTLAQILVT